MVDVGDKNTSLGTTESFWGEWQNKTPKFPWIEVLERDWRYRIYCIYFYLFIYIVYIYLFIYKGIFFIAEFDQTSWYLSCFINPLTIGYSYVPLIDPAVDQGDCASTRRFRKLGPHLVSYFYVDVQQYNTYFIFSWLSN